MLNFNIKYLMINLKKRADHKYLPSHHLNIIYEN